MTTQSEAALERELVNQLTSIGWENVSVKNETDLVQNLKTQLEVHNSKTFTTKEFKDILTRISLGDIFEKAKRLRGKMEYQQDDGEIGYLSLVDSIDWCKNEFQVTHQVEMEGTYKNRYDVTLLINGLPLVQIELKRRGNSLKEAFKQTGRYHLHSYSAGCGLFSYIQIFVISNGVNTKYYANNPPRDRDFKQTFFWADKKNRKLTNLQEFVDTFLEPCLLSKLVAKYVVISESEKMLMVLRQYQYHAVEAIVERVKTSNKFGYIWHTTGSGKTLTSFKAAQILTGMSGIHKVVFVVDRKDLDYKTIEDFNSFKPDSIDGTDNTRALVRQFNDDTKLIVTTLQKLNHAIQKSRYKSVMQPLREKRMVFIFDECHRSQFGQTHARLREFFPKVQMFGFTGTPIFAENAVGNEHGKRTTADLFGECLHKYVITDAISDQNVLRFSIEYISTFKEHEKDTPDIQVEGIDRAEVLEADERLEKVVDHIIENHQRKTHNREFNSIFCVSDIRTLLRYYEVFQRKKENGEHDLNVATIFSYSSNEDDSDESGSLETDLSDASSTSVIPHNRDQLEACIEDYNTSFGTNYSTDSFYNYYQDIGKRLRRHAENRNAGTGIDIQLVVNMFLTGYDSKWLNTIYVDKNLKYHGLIQAYSRTNRILRTKKSHGNVVCYRNLKAATDEAVALFADKEAMEVIALESYEHYVKKCNEVIAELLKITPNIGSVDSLKDENEQANFIKIFREILRTINVLQTFVQFSYDDIKLDAQSIADYQSKYQDLYDRVKTNRQTEQISILDSIDFEIELIHRDEINVRYILDLVVRMRQAKAEEKDKHYQSIMSALESEPQLRSKKELIKKFVQEHVPLLLPEADVREAFDDYVEEQRHEALDSLCSDEGLRRERVDRVIRDYLYTGKNPLDRSLIALLHETPPLKQRTSVKNRLLNRILAFVETYYEGMDFVE